MKPPRHQQILLFVIVYLATTALIVTISSPFYRAYEKQRITVLTERELGYINNAQQLVRSSFSNAVADLNYIASLLLVPDGLREQTSEKLDLIADYFAAFANSYQRYHQIRILSRDGNELVRVNFNDGHAEIVPKHALQDKSHRNYIRAITELEPGQIYVSPIELNQEHGTYVTPYEPTVRLAKSISVPVDGQPLGILVLNQRTKLLLDEFSILMAANTYHEGYLIDGFGQWIAKPGAGAELFLREEGTSFAQQRPEVWGHIREQASGSYLHDDGLYFYKTLAGQHQESAIVSENRTQGDEAYSVKIVLFLPNSSLYATSFLHRPGAEWAIGSGLLTYALMVWSFCTLLLKNRLQKARDKDNTDELELLYESAPCGYMSVHKGNITKINTTLANWLGYDKDEMVNNIRFEDIVTPEGYEHLKGLDREMGEQHSLLDVTEDLVTKDGHLLPVSLSASIDPAGVDSSGFVRISVVDITDRRVKEQLLEVKATTDELTGLYNRRQFFDHAEWEISRIRRNNQPLSVMLLDADKFKRINDTYGHNAGDLVLKALSNQITDTLREGDLLARYGGEEFVVLLPSSDVTVAHQVAERVRRIVETNPIMIDTDNSLAVTVSIGVSQWNENDQSIDDVIKRADIALYRAKDSGRNRVCVAESSLSAQ